MLVCFLGAGGERGERGERGRGGREKRPGLQRAPIAGGPGKQHVSTGCKMSSFNKGAIVLFFLVAVDPPAKSLTFWEFSGKHLYFQKVRV